MANKVTVKSLEALKPGREVVIDPGSRGQGALILRTTASAKAFYYRYFFESKRRFELVGYFDPEHGARHWRDGDRTHKGGLLTLAAAREGCAALRLLAAAAGDLKAHFAGEEAKEEAARRQAEEDARAGTFGDLLRIYVEALKAAGKPSWREAEAVFGRNVEKPFPNLVKRRANEITPEDIQGILARMVKRGAKRQTNITRSYLRAAFQHGGRGHDYDPRRLAKEDKVFQLRGNPVDMIPRIREFDRIGERVLSAEEVHAYFKALDTLGNPVMRAALKFHCLTGGQRPKQLLAAPWRNYDLEGGVLTIADPKGRARSRDHLVPLLPEALALLNDLKPLTGSFEWPFSVYGKAPIRLETLANAVGALAKTLGPNPFTLRDIRRTVETTLAALGVTKETRAQLLSHGRSDKITRTYDKHHYLAEKRAALKVWLDFLLEREAAPGKVVPMGSRRS